ncbi:MAG: 2-oxoisovalerate dehydrogenase [Candidatus Kapaibacterium sp.]
MNEIIFLIEEALEGGYTARALGESIFTEGENMQDLRHNIIDAIKCHFDEDNLPKIVRMHFVREEIFALT